MKKQYIIPTTRLVNMSLATLVCTSVGIKGDYDEGLTIGSKDRTDENDEGGIW